MKIRTFATLLDGVLPAYYKSQRPLREKQKWRRHCWLPLLLSDAGSRQLGCQQDTTPCQNP